MLMKMGIAQVVVMGEKVYTGGGVTKYYGDHNQVFQYDPSLIIRIHVTNHNSHYVWCDINIVSFPDLYLDLILEKTKTAVRQK